MTETPPFNGTVFVLDLDNTLCECTEAYIYAKAEFTKLMNAEMPAVSEDEAFKTFSTIDAERFKTLETSPERFPGSMVIAAKQLYKSQGQELPEEIKRRVRKIGDDVFDFDYPPYPGALELLTQIRQSGAKIAICTKGDETVQKQKLTRWSYQQYVDALHICQAKTKEEIIKAAQLASPSWQRLVMIGDTRRDDIAAGNEAGATTVWIRNPQLTKGWTYDKDQDAITPTFTVERTADVKNAISHLLTPPATTCDKPPIKQRSI